MPQDPWEQLWEAIGAVFDSWNNDRAVDLPQDQQHPGRLGHRGHRAIDGLRQPRRGLRDRRRLHARSLHRREGHLRRVPAQRAGRGRGRGNPHAAPDKPGCRARVGRAQRHRRKRTPRPARHARGELSPGLPRAAEDRIAAGTATSATCRTWSSPSSAASSSCCRRATANARPKPRCASPSRWRRRGSSTGGTALMRVEPVQLEQLLHPRLDPARPRKVMARGLPASPGAVAGEVVFSRRRSGCGDQGRAQGDPGAHRDFARGHPRDAGGGGNPDRARRDDQPCRGGRARDGQVLRRGMLGDSKSTTPPARSVPPATAWFIAANIITLDGTAGEVIAGRVPTVEPVMSPFFTKFMSDGPTRSARSACAPTPTRRTTPKSRANSAPKESDCAAPSICSSAPERIEAVREMILAENARAARAGAGENSADAARRFRRHPARDGGTAGHDSPARSAAARVPAHRRREIRELAAKIGVTPEHLKQVRDSLFEFNPMLGHRGSRLGISYPEIYKAQVRAILEAAMPVACRGRASAIPEIMLPLIGERQRIRGAGRRDSRSAPGGLGTRQSSRITDRHDDRSAARLHRGRPDRRGRRVLLLRHQRPDADDLRAVARRLGQVPRRLYRARHLQEGPVRRSSTPTASAA